MADKEYQGWANYETWSVALIVDNEQSLYGRRRVMAREYWENVDTDANTYTRSLTRSDRARYAFADELKDWVTDQTVANVAGYEDSGSTPSDFALLAAQLLQGALSEVDWSEIADNWLNEEINENGDGGYESEK